MRESFPTYFLTATYRAVGWKKKLFRGTFFDPFETQNFSRISDPDTVNIYDKSTRGNVKLQ